MLSLTCLVIVQMNKIVYDLMLSFPLLVCYMFVPLSLSLYVYTQGLLPFHLDLHGKRRRLHEGALDIGKYIIIISFVSYIHIPHDYLIMGGCRGHGSSMEYMCMYINMYRNVSNGGVMG